jgi:hypothetical protein
MCLFDDGSPPKTFDVAVAPSSRVTVDLASLVGAGHTGVSVKVESNHELTAERSMYFDRLMPDGAANGSHSVLGVSAPQEHWAFAEGSTLSGFDEYLTLSNPGTTPANVAIVFGLDTGPPVSITTTVPPTSRQTMPVKDVLGPGVTGHATFVSSDQPVLAERPMYFHRAIGDDGAEIDGGDAAFGVSPERVWSFAEGTLLADFSTFLTIANPDAQTAASTLITYFLTDGTTLTRTLSVSPNGRSTVRVFDPGDPAGLGRGLSDPVSRGVAIQVSTTSPAGLVVERAVYFHHDFGSGTVVDGHVSSGASALATHWRFAEGSTLPGFLPYLTVLNPSDAGSPLTIAYLPDVGPPIERAVVAPPNSRITVPVAGPASEGGVGTELTGFGIAVSSEQPVMVERVMYTDRALPGLPVVTGGSVVVGSPRP